MNTDKHVSPKQIEAVKGYVLLKQWVGDSGFMFATGASLGACKLQVEE